MSKLSVSLGKIKLTNPVVAASGTFKLVAQPLKRLKVAVGQGLLHGFNLLGQARDKLAKYFYEVGIIGKFGLDCLWRVG